jgi:hypothetical protein
MSRSFEPDDLDPEERAWHEQKQRAAARRSAAQSMAGGPAISEKDYDEQRRQQMLKDQAAAKALAVSPSTLTGNADPFAIDLTVSVPGSESVVVPPPTAAAPPGPAPAQTQQAGTSSDATFWTCRVMAEDQEIAIYAHTWDDLKIRLLKHPGLWTATEHKFANTPANILGFFVPTQYVFPTNTTVKQFEVIVKDSKVFKAES